MNALAKISLLSAMLALPACASAQSDATPKSTNEMNCPMMKDTSALQKDMGSMMAEMESMMKSTGDTSMRPRMQNMHDQMAAMMTKMRKMNGGMGMMGDDMKSGKLMQGGEAPSPAPSAVPSTSPEDHKAHHP